MTLDSVLTALYSKINAPATPGTAGQRLTTNGEGQRSWSGSSSVIAADRLTIDNTEYILRTGSAGAAGYITIGANKIWIGTQECLLDLAGRAVAKIYIGATLAYEKPAEAIYLFNDGYTGGYTWQVNHFPRPQYTAYADGFLTHVAETPGYMLLRISDNDSEYSHNAHVNLSAPVVVPTNMTRLNVEVYRNTTNTVLMRFGLLPANASNSYSIAQGGQLSGEITVPRSKQAYSINLSAAVKGQTLYPIVNGRASADDRRDLRIYKVWFD